MTRFVVTLVTDTSSGYSRGVIRGVVRYAQSVGTWRIRRGPIWDYTTGPQPTTDNSDGVIAQVIDTARATELARLNLPVVNVANLIAETGFHTVLVDDRAVGRLAAEHFLERGFTQFAYCGYFSMHVAHERLGGFRERLESAGVTLGEDRVIELTDRDAGAELARLPRPCAVFAVSDGACTHVLDNARDAGIAVPEHIALLGVDDDEFLTALSPITLSSVRLPLERIGEEAARLLDRLLAGERDVPRLLRLPPVGVVTRHSSDVLAVEDPAVAEAMQYIREHQAEPDLRADRVVSAVAVSRRALERRFRAALKRSILDEVHRVRVARARELLINTDLDIAAVARRCGFTTATRLHIVFRNLTGQTPAAYRKKSGRRR